LLVSGPRDHVHLLLRLPAPLSVSDLMEKVKGGFSRWVHERWPTSSSFAWQTGYAATNWIPAVAGMTRRGRLALPQTGRGSC
jgi:REP element-mobilizing transposase RayT